MTEKRDIKEWTLMFYFASDNPLAPAVVSQLKALKEAGHHPQANVIAQFDPHTKNVPSHIFEVNLVNKLKAGNKPQVGFKSNDPFVRNLVFDKLWLKKDAETKKIIGDSLKRRKGRKIVYNPPTPSDDMAYETNPKDALAKFLEFCKMEYPARRYMLFVLGHGLIVGNDLFLFDENAPEPRLTAKVVASSASQNSKKPNGNTPNNITKERPAQHSLLLRDLGVVLRGFKESIGDSSFELIGFHSCSMSGLELAYEIRGSANYMLGSQGPAFVGSWPYRQILIRVFNDLNSEMFRDVDLNDVDSLIAKLRQRTDPVSEDIFPRLTEATRKLLDEQNDTAQFHKKIIDALVEELNNLLYDIDPQKDAWVNDAKLSPETKRLKDKELHGMDRIRLNRMLLQDAFKSEIAKQKKTRRKDKEKKDVKEMFITFFNYCMFNSYDFQLAGYSYDLCLCDLSKLKDEENELTEPLKKLSAALREGVQDMHTRELILRAHRKSQSYFQQKYTDLYDFCFCFVKAFDDAYIGDESTRPYANQESREIPEKTRGACEEVQEALLRGVESDDDKLIVRCEYVGPTYQYSHGLSVFFPWSRPIDEFFSEQYMHYAFNETEWGKFLDEYFTVTMRALQVSEVDIVDRVRGDSFHADKADFGRSSKLERQVVEKIAGVIFNSDGQLSKGGSGDKTGDDCECSEIKNYPSFKNAARSQDSEKYEHFPVRKDFQFRQS